MGILWVIEKPEEGKPSIACRLQGDFAVRRFASLESFNRLKNVNNRPEPQALILEERCMTTPGFYINEMIRQAFPHTLALVVCKGKEPKASGAPMFPMICDDGQGLSLVRQVRHALSGKEEGFHDRHIIKYKNIYFDFEKLKLKLLPSKADVSLSLKEARLLKMFVENAGQCLSRDKIKQVIWQNDAVSPRTIDSHISRLRKRLKFAEAAIKSVYGGGYILK